MGSSPPFPCVVSLSLVVLVRWRRKSANTNTLLVFLLLQHYRYWVVWRCPTVRFLDYQKVKQAEREKAAELFGTADEPTELASSVSFISHLSFSCRHRAHTDTDE